MRRRRRALLGASSTDDYLQLGKETPMNTDQMKGKATQIAGKLKETWGKLTDDDIALYDGQREKFLGKVQESYGLAKEAAEKQLRSIEEAQKSSTQRAA
jgi:uncharacterized protein YjbJ (UPF0337 family)